MPADKRRIDAVLMDVQMPVMDGLEATRILRQEHQLLDLPIIAITAGVETKDRQKCLAVGMTDFLAKPISMTALCRIIQLHCKRQKVPPASPAIEDHAVDTLDNPPGFDLMSAIDRLGGDVATYVRLMKKFLGSLETTRRSLHEQFQDASVAGTQQVAKQLHGFRSSLLTLGATDLADLTRAIETSLANSEPVDRKTKLAELDAAFARVWDVFQAAIEHLEKKS